MAKKETAEATKTFPIDALIPIHAKLVPLHPVKLEPIGGYVMLAGMDSPEFTNAVNAIVLLEKNSKDDSELSELERFQVMESRTRELAGRCIVGWDEIYFGPYSIDRAVQMMHQAKWLFVQVQKFLEDRANFYTA